MKIMNKAVLIIGLIFVALGVINKCSFNNKPIISPNNGVHNIKNDKINIDSYIGVIEIPKINLKHEFYNINSKYNNVDYGITIINGSTFPNTENNNLILASHSGNCSYCYFNELYKLSIGDKVYINYNNKVYKYALVNIYNVLKDGSVPIYRDYKKSVLTLITCAKNSKTEQTIYILELI